MLFFLFQTCRFLKKAWQKLLEMGLCKAFANPKIYPLTRFFVRLFCKKVGKAWQKLLEMGFCKAFANPKIYPLTRFFARLFCKKVGKAWQKLLEMGFCKAFANPKIYYKVFCPTFLQKSRKIPSQNACKYAFCSSLNVSIETPMAVNFACATAESISLGTG